MIVNSKILLNSNHYKSMSINSGKNGLSVRVTDNIFNRSKEFKLFVKDFFDKPSIDILKGINDKSEIEQLDILVSYFARNNTIKEIITMGPIKVVGSSQVLTLKVGNKFNSIGQKIVRKYNEDRIRFYGSHAECKHYVIGLAFDVTGYKIDGEKIYFDLKNDDNPKYRYDKGLHLVDIDEKFLKIFLREQVINKNGDVIKENGGIFNVIRIGDTTISYEKEFEREFNMALIERNIRIDNEKRMQYKLDV